MLRAIARALARLTSLGWKGLCGLGNYTWTCVQTAGYWGEQFLRWPFSVLRGGGGGLPAPEFAAGQSANDILDEFSERRARASAVHTLDRDGVDTVISYAKAAPSVRNGFDFGALDTDVRATLISMDDAELKALAEASKNLNRIRRFVTKQEHGIHGVPVVRPLGEPVRPTPRSAEENELWTMQARIRKAAESGQFALGR